MAYSPSEKYPGAVDSDPNYKGGKFRDNNPSTTNNGSPLKAIDRNELLARDEAIMNDAGFDYNGLPDTPQDSQLFKAYKASLGNGANLLSNHNFLIPSPDDSQPAPSATPTSYPPGFQIFSGVFANETTGISNLTYIDGRVSFSGGDLYFAVPNTGGLERLDADQFVASVADFDGKPRTRGVSFALVGDEYRVTVGIDALSDGVDDTLLGSVKFEQGKVATGHVVVGNSQEQAYFGDIQIVGKIWPIDSTNSAEDGCDLSGYEIVRLKGGDFGEVTQFLTFKQDGSRSIPTGILTNINLTTRPYSATVGADNVYLLDPSSTKKRIPTLDSFFLDKTGVTDELAGLNAFWSLGGCLKGSEGIYAFDGQMVMQSNTDFEGCGEGITVFKPLDNSISGKLVTTRRSAGTALDSFKENINIRKFSIESDVTAPLSDINTIVFSWFKNCHVSDVFIKGGNGASVRFDGYGDVFEDGAYLDSDALEDNPLSTQVIGQDLITVKHVRHGLNSGALVTISGAVDFNGMPEVEINAEHKINVLDENRYRFSIASTATSTGDGGGSNVIASNPRHATRWSQGENFSAENIRCDGGYLGVELEGGVFDGWVKKIRGDNISLYTVRIPSAYDVDCEDVNSNGGNSLFWVDRSARIRCSKSKGVGLNRNGIALGICRDSTFKEINVQINDDVTYNAVSDNFQRVDAGVERVTFKEITSSGSIRLDAGSEDCIVKENACPIDVMRPLNRNVIVKDNTGYIVRSSALDPNSTRFGGTAADIQSGVEFNGERSRNARLSGLTANALISFRGSDLAILNDEKFGLSKTIGISKTSTGEYIVTVEGVVNGSILAYPHCEFSGVDAIAGGAIGNEVTILTKDSSGAPVDPSRVNVLLFWH